MWFVNHYECAECNETWADEWSCMCDDECPECGARNMSPIKSDDLTYVVEEADFEFFVLRSSDAAEHTPDYQDVGCFKSKHAAELYIENLTSSIRA